MYDLRTAARALDGEICNGQILCPGPGHSRRDRSLTVRLSPGAPDGFLVFSHAGDPFPDCKDHVRQRLGIERERDLLQGPAKPQRREPDKPAPHEDDAKRIADAGALWRESADPRGSIVEVYFALRKLNSDDLADLAGRVIRWNSRINAMVALFRNIETGKPQAVSRTYLDREGRKLERKFLGPVGGAAVMLDAFDSVCQGLHIGEGLETCQSARKLGLKPTWALGSAGAIAAFPVLGGIDCLTVLAENDVASARAVETCGGRWHDAGRIVLINRPAHGKDLNDAIGGMA